MNRNLYLSLLAVIVIAVAAWQIIESQHDHADSRDHHAGHGHHDDGKDAHPRGPNNGKLFSHDDFTIELVLYETGVPPEFHVYAYRQGMLLPPQDVEMRIELKRLDGQVDRIGFEALGDFQRGDTVVTEPHSFDVHISAQYQGRSYDWYFESYEGRTTIPAELALEAGIEIETAGAVTLTETLSLNGRVQADPTRVAQVRARFVGSVQSVNRTIGEKVEKGDVLATVQSNESLQNYNVQAPIDGLVLSSSVQIGATTGEAPLFVIADSSRVWVELDVFGKHLSQVETGQKVRIKTITGEISESEISFVSPLALHASQSVQARVELDNAQGRLRPGQFVTAEVIVAEHEVPLAVRQSAIQGFRDFRVVYTRVGETYEVRMLELGRQNAEWAEVLGGLKPGSPYVTRNSYLIKADIEKSAASHDH